MRSATQTFWSEVWHCKLQFCIVCISHILMRMGSFTLGWVLSPKVEADHPKLVRHGRWKLTCQWFHRQTILNPGAKYFQGFYPKDMWIFLSSIWKWDQPLHCWPVTARNHRPGRLSFGIFTDYNNLVPSLLMHLLPCVLQKQDQGPRSWHGLCRHPVSMPQWGKFLRWGCRPNLSGKREPAGDRRTLSEEQSGKSRDSSQNWLGCRSITGLSRKVTKSAGQKNRQGI